MYAVDYGRPQLARHDYANLEQAAEACLSCSGAPCHGACPNGIPIAARTRATVVVVRSRPFGTSTLGAGYVAATVVAEDLGVREAQDWWRYRPLEAGLEVLRRRGIEIDFSC